MVRYNKRVLKGIDFKCKFTKPRYWDKEVYSKITQDTTLNVELTPYDGLSYETKVNYGGVPTRVKIDEGILPDYTTYNGTSGYLITPPSEGHYLFPEYKYSYLIKVGNISVDEQTGHVANFNSSNYIKTNYKFLPQNNSWLWQVKFNQTEAYTGSSVQYIMCSSTSSKAPYIAISATGEITAYLSSGGSSISTIATSTFKITQNQDYWVQLEYDGNGIYSLRYSTDGESYNLIGTLENTTTVTASEVMWFGKSGQGTYFRGQIDFSKTFIQINNQIAWEPHGITSIVVDSYLFDEGVEKKGITNYNIFINNDKTVLNTAETKDGYLWAGEVSINKPYDGNPEILYADFVGDCKIISHYGEFFSATNYFVSTKKFLYSGFFAHRLDIITRVKTGLTALNHCIIWDNSENNHGFGTGTNKQWRIYDGTNYYGGSFEYDTQYWVKFVQDNPTEGLPYVALYYMIYDGSYSSYEDLPEVSDSCWNKAVQIDNVVELFGNNLLRIGNSYSSTSEYWQNSIDLANTVLRDSSGAVYWRALDPVKITPEIL